MVNRDYEDNRNSADYFLLSNVRRTWNTATLLAHANNAAKLYYLAQKKHDLNHILLI